MIYNSKKKKKEINHRFHTNKQEREKEIKKKRKQVKKMVDEGAGGQCTCKYPYSSAKNVTLVKRQILRSI